MNKKEAENRTSLAESRRVKKLREEISRLRFLYHVENSPDVTDDIYESLTRELNELEIKYPELRDENSSLNRIAGKPLPEFKKIQHKERMLSMNDVFSEEELFAWEKKISKLTNQKHTYFCELKLDGLSASLIYENGIFIRGATRGDGFIGEDITENLKMIESVPLRLKTPYPNNIEIRGEVIMPKKAWINLNKEQEKEGKPLFANTRNAAAGSLRQLDPQVVKGRRLEFFAWDAMVDDKKIEKHSEKHKLIKSLGFLLPNYEKEAKDLNEVINFIREIENKRKDLPFGTDGMVISVDELSIQKSLGIVGKAPRYMVAYKYPAEKATTVVSDISVSVGRTGVLTPVAHFHPTLVAGSTVSKATLHNIDQINRLDVRIGDTIVIQKAGDVIPEVVEVLTNMRTGKEKKFKMPTECPICGTLVKQKDTGFGKSSSSQGFSKKDETGILSGKALRRPTGPSREIFQQENIRAFQDNISVKSVAYYCTNRNCPAKNSRNMQHFVNAFEIYEIGPKILGRLKDEGLISDGADLFTLEKSDLSGLERFGEKSADNIISSIESHKKVLFWRFIYALGIVHVGEETSRDLANHFRSLDKLMKAGEEEINNIENIGPVVSKSIYEFFRDKININFINKLLSNGVSVYQLKPKNYKLAQKTFVLTGTLSSMSREEAKKKIIENGGKVSGSVSPKTSYVVAGENPGSKYTDAQKFGVKILSESEFQKMI